MPVTLNDVAQKCGVSIHTVSKIINLKKDADFAELTVQKVRSAAEELQYQPNYLASALRSGKRNCIGVAGTAQLRQFDDLAANRVYAGIGEVVQAHKNAMTLFPLDLEEFRGMVMQASKTRMVDGLILLAYTRQYHNFRDGVIPDMKKDGMPLVIIHTTTEEFDCPNVGINMPQAGYLATKHLIDQGHTDIACVNVDGYYNNEYYKGYRQVISVAGLPDQYQPIGFWTYSAEDGYITGKELIKKHGIHSAYVVYTDQFAYGLIRALKEAGKRVPEDVAIVGGGSLLKEMYRDNFLTSIDFKYEERGRKAAEMLFGQIEKKDSEVKQFLAEPELIVRNSSLR
jgi:DNA-binding LacI/PurR family transcriptional regulator